MVQRVPIKVYRQPIKLPLDIKMQLKLQEMQEHTKEDDIIELSRHYDMMVIKSSSKGGYYSLSQNDPTRHRNWKHFERVYEICRMKEWDSKLYIESQFDRAKRWENGKFSYPQPSMMYSVDAIKHFVRYFGDLHKKHRYDTNADKKKRGRETTTLRTQVINDIVSSVESLAFYVKNSNFEDKKQYKALRIYQSWQELSPYYLWSVPWFDKILQEVSAETPKAEEYRNEFLRISKSPSLRDVIKETVLATEKHFNIPENMEL